MATRSLILHAQQRWPEVISTLLWPFSWSAAEYQYNNLRFKDGKSPMQNYTNYTCSRLNIVDHYTWGSPTYVLTSKAQQGVLPQWDTRSRLGVYLGQSPIHASTVALVLNLKSLHVSPQFHVIFDDDFSTVDFINNGEILSNWKQLVKASYR